MNLVKALCFFVRFAVNAYAGLLVVLITIWATWIALYERQSAFFSPEADGMAELYFASIVMIFPFRLIRSIFYLKIYVFLLLLATLYYLLLGNNEVLIEKIIIGVFVILNFSFVVLYLLHKQDSRRINPFMERKAYKKLLAKVFYK